MATSRAPVFLRPRNYQWYWNSSADPWAVGANDWTKFTDVENEIIEDVFNAKKAEVEIDGGYVIDLTHQIQYNKLDQHKQRPIKRVKLKSDRSNVHLREERFSLPVTLASTSSAATNDTLCLKNIVGISDFTATYYRHELENKDKRLADFVEEAAKGIIQEGTALNKTQEARWLAEQLLEVKRYIHNIQTNRYTSKSKIPDEIGQTCVYLYTKETFWYKLINKILRNPDTVTRQQLNTLGPFCYLLMNYLWQTKTTDVLKVYRGLTLTDEQRKEFIKEEGDAMYFTSFTSTSRNQTKAEQFGNTLLVIDLNVQNESGEPVEYGADISSLSDFPDEEEFLIWPANAFHFVKYEYDSAKNKHIIYLRASEWNIT